MSLLSKQEFAVPRVIARVNNPKNEWMFNDSWGVDVAVCTPHLITGLVQEAVTVGSFVRLMSFEGGKARLAEVTPRRGRRRTARRSPSWASRATPRSWPSCVRTGCRAPWRHHPAHGDEVLVLVTDESEARRARAPRRAVAVSGLRAHGTSV